MADYLIVSLVSHFNFLDKKELFKLVAIYLLNKEFLKCTKQSTVQIFDIYKFEFEEKVLLSNMEYLDSVLGGVEYSEDMIGIIYETCLTKEYIKDYGLFYTRNNTITDIIIDNVIDSINKESTILEPSSGSGLFLTRLIERLKTNKNKNFDIVSFVFNKIHFNDFDIFACFLTEFNIIHSIIEEISFDFVSNKSLKLNKLNMYNEDFSIIDISILPKFDIVIGNPPYVTLYGKRSRNMTNDKRVYYNNRYKFIEDKKKDNKFNLVMFFIENSLDLLKPNGYCSFIIDVSFFESAYNDLRMYLLRNYSIVNLYSNIKAWNNVASSQIIITLKNKKNGNNTTEWHTGSNVEKINQSIWLSDGKINLPKNTITKSILNKIQTKTNTVLGDILDGKKLRTCCALTGRTSDFLKNESDYINNKNKIFRYLEGSKGLSEKFGKLKHTNYLSMDYSLQDKISKEFQIELKKLGVKNKKRVTLGNRSAYEHPKLFIRQSASVLISTYTEEIYAANNSIYVATLFSDTNDSKKMLKYINAYLNSDIATFCALEMNIIRSGVGKTPQIKISDLKRLPVLKDMKLLDLFVSTTDQPSLNNIRELNKELYKYFELTEDEIAFVKSKT